MRSYKTTIEPSGRGDYATVLWHRVPNSRWFELERYDGLTWGEALDVENEVVDSLLRLDVPGRA